MPAPHSPLENSSEDGKMAIDPVCGMEVDENSAKDRSSFEGKTYFFCSTDCREEFDEAPEEYIGEGEEERQTGT